MFLISLHTMLIHVLSRFIQPPSIEELESRLTKRGTETPDSLAKRLASAQEAFDYAKAEGSYDLTVVNDSIDGAYAKLEEFVLAHWSHLE
jgi:guanylate kinase